MARLLRRPRVISCDALHVVAGIGLPRLDLLLARQRMLHHRYESHAFEHSFAESKNAPGSVTQDDKGAFGSK
jgi:hypothetical protein